MAENELAVMTSLSDLPETQLPAQVSDDVFDKMVRGAFLPRVQLMSGMSELVTEGKMRVGNYALTRGKDDFIDLGETFNCIPASYRLIAMRFLPGSFKAVYDVESEEFRQIQLESAEPNSKCGYGPQFLIWLPDQKEFATYLFGSKSARPEARSLKVLLKQPATFRAKLVTANTNRWHVPTVMKCSNTNLPLPSIAAWTTEVEKFNTPPKAEEQFDPQQSASNAPADNGGVVR